MLVHQSSTRRKSCTACVQAKRRCDLRLPQCTRCVKRKADCKYVSKYTSLKVILTHPGHPLPEAYCGEKTANHEQGVSTNRHATSSTDLANKPSNSQRIQLGNCSTLRHLDNRILPHPRKSSHQTRPNRFLHQPIQKSHPTISTTKQIALHPPRCLSESTSNRLPRSSGYYRHVLSKITPEPNYDLLNARLSSFQSHRIREIFILVNGRLFAWCSGTHFIPNNSAFRWRHKTTSQCRKR